MLHNWGINKLIPVQSANDRLTGLVHSLRVPQGRLRQMIKKKKTGIKTGTGMTIHVQVIVETGVYEIFFTESLKR